MPYNPSQSLAKYYSIVHGDSYIPDVNAPFKWAESFQRGWAMGQGQANLENQQDAQREAARQKKIQDNIKAINELDYKDLTNKHIATLRRDAAKLGEDYSNGNITDQEFQARKADLEIAFQVGRNQSAAIKETIKNGNKFVAFEETQVPAFNGQKMARDEKGFYYLNDKGSKIYEEPNGSVSAYSRANAIGDLLTYSSDSSPAESIYDIGSVYSNVRGSLLERPNINIPKIVNTAVDNTNPLGGSMYDTGSDVLDYSVVGERSYYTDDQIKEMQSQMTNYPQIMVQSMVDGTEGGQVVFKEDLQNNLNNLVRYTAENKAERDLSLKREKEGDEWRRTGSGWTNGQFNFSVRDEDRDWQLSVEEGKMKPAKSRTLVITPANRKGDLGYITMTNPDGKEVSVYPSKFRVLEDGNIAMYGRMAEKGMFDMQPSDKSFDWQILSDDNVQKIETKYQFDFDDISEEVDTTSEKINPTPTQEEWNKAWESLKSGESMMGLDGVEYVKD